MARSINSPGVQIIETDYSQYQNFGGGTRIFIPGFAAQGPTDEVLQITSISEFEQVYGTPQTAAERYFYYSAKEVLNAPSTLLTTRLPYGSGFGEGFANQYSALLFPVVSSVSTSTSGIDQFIVGEPTFVNLTDAQYNDIVQNNITWSSIVSGTSANVSSASWNSTTRNISAGIIICNASKTAQNESYEGYYLTVTDNVEFAQGSDFTAVTQFYTLSGQQAPYYVVPTSRYEFPLSGSRDTAGGGSVSETIESQYDWTLNQSTYDNILSINLFKVRRSVYEPTQLVISPVENHLGSLKSGDVQFAGGVTPRSFFLENVINNSSPNLKVLVNPNIAINGAWSSPTPPKVRITSGLKALYPHSVWMPSYAASTSKQIGNLVSKVERALTLVETSETTPLDVVCDAGLTTVYVTTYKSVSSGASLFDETTFISPSSFSVSNDENVLRYKTLVNVFGNFAQNTRKDCMFIADPVRQIFVNGENTKNLSVRTNTFTQTIFNPLKTIFDTSNNNYMATYGNWVKTYDQYSDKNVWLPFSGYAAAIYARVDANNQPWFAPAGLNRGSVPNIIDLAINPNQKQRDALYTISINPVVFFSGDGFSVFGQKTMQKKPSAFDRINVRRLFLSLEKATQQSLRYFVFEPNTEFTRTRLKNTLFPIFELARNTQGLYDYLIVCDERNNPPDLIDRNELAIDIYIKPVKAAEFILVNFIATRTGQNFQELI